MKKNTKQLSKIRFIIDTILWIILATAVTMAYIDGHFIHKEVKIVETCEGKPTNTNIQIPEEIKNIIHEQEGETKWLIKNPNN